jgi:hypothetical protein
MRVSGGRPTTARNTPTQVCFGASKDGSHIAIVLSMRKKAASHRNTGMASFARGVRAFAEATLVALAFGFAIFLIGLPLALSVRVVHESLSWLVQLGGDVGPAAEVVTVASVVGGIMLTAVFAAALVRFFRWRGALRRESRTSDPGTEPVLVRQLRTAAS